MTAIATEDRLTPPSAQPEPQSEQPPLLRLHRSAVRTPTITATMAVTIAGMPPATGSSVSPEPGSVAKTAAGTFVSKRYSKRAAFQTDPARSTRERLDNADTSATYNANGRSAKEDAAVKKNQ